MANRPELKSTLTEHLKVLSKAGLVWKKKQNLGGSCRVGWKRTDQYENAEKNLLKKTSSLGVKEVRSLLEKRG